MNDGATNSFESNVDNGNSESNGVITLDPITIYADEDTSLSDSLKTYDYSVLAYEAFTYTNVGAVYDTLQSYYDGEIDTLQLAGYGVIALGTGGMGVKAAKSLGRLGKQKRLRELMNDSKVASRDRGWIKQELNQIKRGKRRSIRVPIGKNLAHRRGYEAKKGYGYDYSDLQDIDLHKLQHRFEGY
nr:hypothetical protein [Campylobacterota bacterium]